MARDAVATMGAVLPDDVGGRDAVHVAVIAVKVLGGTWAGGHVGIEQTESGYIASPQLTPHVGIIDPFINSRIEEGSRCWLYLYPRTITGLSHVWTHPAFPDAKPTTEKEKSENWLRQFIAGADCPNYEGMMEILGKIAKGETRGQFGSDDSDNYWRLEDEYLHFNGTNAHGDIPPEFWQHASVVAGVKIKGEMPTYFSCSC